VEGAFVNSGVETIFSESPEYFVDMFSVDLNVVGIDEDVIEIDNNAIEHVGEDVIHKYLEHCRGVGESKGHDLPFK